MEQVVPEHKATAMGKPVMQAPPQVARNVVVAIQAVPEEMAAVQEMVLLPVVAEADI